MRDYITPEEFEKRAEPATAFNECTEKLEREASETLINEFQVRRNRELSNIFCVEVDYNIK